MTKEEWTARGYRFEFHGYQTKEGDFHLHLSWFQDKDAGQGRGPLVKSRKFEHISFEEAMEQVSFPAHLIPRP